MAKLVLATPGGLMAVKKALVVGKNVIIKQSPIILACAAVGGVITTVVLASDAGIQANDILKEAEHEKKIVDGEEAVLSIPEKVSACWKVYIPTAISAGLTIGAIVASSAISQKRQAALAGLYALSETALKEYQEKIEKELGPNKARAIRDEINQDAISSHPVPEKVSALSIPSGKVLCLDKMSGQYFHASVESMKKACNELNHGILVGDMCASLNDLYGLINAEDLLLNGFGDEIGWNINRLCELYFTSGLTSQMEPVLVLDFETGHEPTYDYRDM